MAPRSGPATWLDGKARTAGTLAIVGRHLRFDAADPRTPGVALEVVDIKRLHRTQRGPLGLPLLPSGLDVEMRNEQRFAFTVQDRKAWIAAIDEAAELTPKS